MPRPSEFEESAEDGGGADDDVNGDRPTQIPKEQSSRMRPSAERTQPAPETRAEERRNPEESAFIARLGSLARVPIRVENDHRFVNVRSFCQWKTPVCGEATSC